MGATSKETHGILDELISTIPDADVHVLFTEIEEGGLKASTRSTPAVDVNIAAGRLFGGGGHARAAGFKLKQFGNFQLAVLECVQKLKEEVRRQRTEASAPIVPSTSSPKAPVIVPEVVTSTSSNVAPIVKEPTPAVVDVLDGLSGE